MLMEPIASIVHAARRLRRSPGFSLVATGTLATAIAAATTVFAVLDAVLLRAPEYAEPDRLVLVWKRTDAQPTARGRIEAPVADAISRGTRQIGALSFVADTRDGVIERDGRAEHIRLGRPAGNLFDVLGVRAAAGRTFEAGEGLVSATDADAVPGVMVLAYDTWTGRFGADPAIIGRTLRIDGADYTVTGVAPPGFTIDLPPASGIDAAVDAWIALRAPLADLQRTDRLRDQDTDNTGVVIARLAAGSDLDRAARELDALSTRLREQDPDLEAEGARFVPVPMTRDATAHVRPALFAVAAAVLLALLVACLNVAGLLIARAAGRRREVAVRSALGASPSRLALLILIEAGVLTGGAAVVGLVLAGWLLDLVRGVAPAGIPGMAKANLGAATLGFTAAAAMATWLLAGGASIATLPLRGDTGTLRGRGSGSAARGMLRRALAVGQVAVSLALLVGTGLLLRTFESLGHVDPGFRPERLLTFELAMPGGSVGGPAARSALMRTLADRIGGIPGVERVGVTGGLPLGGERFTQPVGLDGEPMDAWSRRQVNFRVVSSGYFDAIGTRLLAGRAFTPDEDLIEDARIAIVSRRLAAIVDPAGDAIGRSIRFPLDGEPVRATIVGIAQDVRFDDLEVEGPPAIYVPYRQEASRQVGFAVRTSVEPSTVEGAVRTAIAETAGAAGLPVWAFRPMREFVAAETAPARFTMLITAAFGLIALLLTVLSVYAFIAWLVAERRPEIGLRIALGATPAEVVGLFAGAGVRLGALGLAIGVVLSAAVSRALSGMLFGVGRFDPAVHVAVLAVMAVATLLASLVPAARAAATDPARVLNRD